MLLDSIHYGSHASFVLFNVQQRVSTTKKRTPVKPLKKICCGHKTVNKISLECGKFYFLDLLKFKINKFPWNIEIGIRVMW